MLMDINTLILIMHDLIDFDYVYAQRTQFFYLINYNSTDKTCFLFLF